MDIISFPIKILSKIFHVISKFEFLMNGSSVIIFYIHYYKRYLNDTHIIIIVIHLKPHVYETFIQDINKISSKDQWKFPSAKISTIA